ncbi:MAG: M24 family metallopeptidase, partial [Pseudomonadota bacterium]
LNENGAILHYQLRERVAPTDSRTFLIDAGAMVAGYASDITRTYLADGAKASPFAALLEAMDALQLALCAQVTPGCAYVDLHLDCHHRLGEVLRASGILHGLSAEAAVASGITRTFFPHGLGHFLGLQVHDVAGFQHAPQGDRVAPPQEHPFLRLTRTLQANEVVTIEAGLYFIPMLLATLRASEAGQHVDWSLVDALTPYGGIRIEDDVVATAHGPRNLTREAFAA